MTYKKGNWYVFCDICGQRCYASEATKLSTSTGRGGLIVCPNDVDATDYGLIPYTPSTEKNIPWARPGDTDTTDGTAPINVETSTQLGT